jgi:acetyl-CoA acetyltransferase
MNAVAQQISNNAGSAAPTLNLNDSTTLSSIVTQVTPVGSAGLSETLQSNLADAVSGIASATDAGRIAAKQSEFLDRKAPNAPTIELAANSTNQLAPSITIKLDTRATDGGAAVVLTSMDYARKHLAAGTGSTDQLVRVAAISTVTPTFPNTILEMPNFATDSAAGIPVPERGFKQAIGDAAYAQAGLGPDDVQVAEVYDLSTALELDWYEDLGFCGPGESEKLLRDGVTAIDGRLPVNPSGGLACFGEAVPAQAIAQVCELTWQLRGTAQGAQANGPTVGITANQGLFGHGSSVILTR